MFYICGAQAAVCLTLVLCTSVHKTQKYGLFISIHLQLHYKYPKHTLLLALYDSQTCFPDKKDICWQHVAI